MLVERGANTAAQDQVCANRMMGLALFPDSSFPSFSVRKSGREPGILCLHEWCQDRKDGRKGLIVCGPTRPRTAKRPKMYKVSYLMYLAIGGQLSYTPSVKLIVGWKYVKCSLLVLQIFAIFWLRHAHMRKDTRLSPLFHTESDGKLGRAREQGYDVYRSAKNY